MDRTPTKPEASQGTAYNVAASLAEWAKARLDTWTPQQLRAIEAEQPRRISEAHGARCQARHAQNVHNQ